MEVEKAASKAAYRAAFSKEIAKEEAKEAEESEETIVEAWKAECDRLRLEKGECHNPRLHRRCTSRCRPVASLVAPIWNPRLTAAACC